MVKYEALQGWETKFLIYSLSLPMTSVVPGRLTSHISTIVLRILATEVIEQHLSREVHNLLSFW